MRSKKSNITSLGTGIRWLALPLLACWCVAGFAQVENSPLETQMLPVGEMFSLIIKADGESDPPARITAKALPAEAVFLRNLDGSRTFIWIPDDNDIGESSFFVTITDAKDSAISATYPINLEVFAELPGGDEEQRIVEEAESGEMASSGGAANNLATNDSATTDSTSTDSASTDSTSTDLATSENNDASGEESLLNESRSEDNDQGAAADPPASSATVINDVETVTGAETDNQPSNGIRTAGIVDRPVTPTVASTPEVADTQTAVSVADEEVPQVYPTISLSNQNLTVKVNDPVEVFITHNSGTGSPSTLQAMNLPDGAILSEKPGGHTLRWTPGSADVGVTAIILTARDSANPSLATTSRLGVEVIR